MGLLIFLLWVWEFFIYFGDLGFHFNSVFLRGKVFKSNLFFLMDLAFDVIVRVLRTLCLTSGHEGILLYFFLQSFMVLCFIFRSVICLKLILYKIWNLDWDWFFLYMHINDLLPQHHLLITILSQLNCFCNHCQRLDGHIYVTISGLFILFHWPLYIFTNTILSWLL